eukprot:COSAG02_NODE_55696_length_289_cov_0.805263_1_plen_48_part_10
MMIHSKRRKGVSPDVQRGYDDTRVVPRHDECAAASYVAHDKYIISPAH